jgi:hypothetical protein
MYTTTGSSDLLKLVITGSTVNLDYYCSYFSSGTLSANAGNASAAGTYFLIPGAASYPNGVQAISISNKNISLAVTITVQYVDNALNTRQLLTISLAAQYTLTYTDEGAGFQVYNATGVRQ